MRFLILLLFVPVYSYSQNKIDGLGKFKIGITTLAVIEEIAGELKCKVATVSMAVLVDDVGMMKPSIVELVRGNSLSVESPKNISSCASSRTFYINKYRIADMEIAGIYLIFDNQKMVKLICRASKALNEALEIKYGPVPIELVKDTFKCYHPLTGAETLLEEQTAIRQWQNESIVAQSRAMLLYDRKCNANASADLTIWDNTLLEGQKQCEDETRSQSNTNRKEERKKSLKDF